MCGYFDRKIIQRSGLFDTQFYRARAGLSATTETADALVHYLAVGAAKGLSPHPLIDPACLATIPRLWGRNRLAAYLRAGSRLGHRPNPHFDPAFYRNANPDVRIGGFEPLTHYAARGWREGRWPSAGFDPLAYRGHYGLAENIDPLAHALAHDHAPVATMPAEPSGLSDPWSGLEPFRNGSGPIIDVIVPVYSGYRDSVIALQRVLGAANQHRANVIVIDDASPEQHLSQALAALEQAGHATVLRNATNLGFVAGANRGMAHSQDRDVVLLNSDTEVFDGWLDRIVAAAGRDVATVTPMSNAATILSYPVSLRDNHSPLELDGAALDRLAATLDPTPIEIPTGIGFCMFVARACLDAIGPFDEKAFGRGYGEENDLCRRAAARGWRNVAAPSVFVQHVGGLSFGREREARVEAAVDTVERLHPGYRRSIAQFIRHDPIAPVRQRLDQARIRRAAPDATLTLGGRKGDAEGGVRLLPEYGPRFGLWRFEAPAAPVTPNLPPFDPRASTQELAEHIRRLGIVAIDLRGAEKSAIAQRLHAVGRAAGLTIHAD